MRERIVEQWKQRNTEEIYCNQFDNILSNLDNNTLGRMRTSRFQPGSCCTGATEFRSCRYFPTEILQWKTPLQHTNLLYPFIIFATIVRTLGTSKLQNCFEISSNCTAFLPELRHVSQTPVCFPRNIFKIRRAESGGSKSWFFTILVLCFDVVSFVAES